jgi:hypothetical protein
MNPMNETNTRLNTTRSRLHKEEEGTQDIDCGIIPEQIHISITRSSSEMVVMWLTRKITNDPVCKYFLVKPLNPAEDDNEIIDTTENITRATSNVVTIGQWQATIYSVTLVNLRPYTMYSYKVGDMETGVYSNTYSFSSRHYGGHPFTMVTFADFTVTEEVKNKKQAIKRLVQNLSQFDIILEFGDICYADGDQEVWDKFFNHVQPIAACKPWMVTVGNHENEGEFGFKAFENRFKMPGNNNFWYSFNYGYAHILVISTEHDLSEDSPQHQFIVSDLEKANKFREKVPWIILTGHRAIIGSNKRYFQKPKCEKQRKILTPIIDKYGVDIALFGHCHAYERTHPIYNGEIDPRGTVYLLAGVAGAQLDKEWQIQPQWSAYRTAHHGYGLLHVKSRKKLRFCYHREKDRKMWDSFTLTKRKNDSPNDNVIKKKISYDYENKFLKNWITTGSDTDNHSTEEECYRSKLETNRPFELSLAESNNSQ